MLVVRHDYRGCYHYIQYMSNMFLDPVRHVTVETLVGCCYCYMPLRHGQPAALETDVVKAPVNQLQPETATL